MLADIPERDVFDNNRLANTKQEEITKRPIIENNIKAEKKKNKKRKLLITAA
jgi:hypothetical protein